VTDVKLGMFVFANDSGLGAQTRRLCQMLKPDRLLAIDMSKLSKNSIQHFEWYDNFNGYKVNGVPTNHELIVFLRGLTHVILCETALNNQFYALAKQMNVKVFLQSNYEFCDHLVNNIIPPTKFLMPSYWKIMEMQTEFGEDRVMYLPPPINPIEFKEARQINFARQSTDKPRFLHIVGTLAANDRNGTLSLLESLRYSKGDYELVIRSQHELPKEYIVNDRRVKYDIQNVTDAQDMYKDFDCMILPRRYGGLSLTTNEALMSGLPVIMSDISPNNKLLPAQWCVPAKKIGQFKTRTMIDIHGVDVKMLGKTLDWLCENNLDQMKTQAFEMAHSNFSESVLQSKYEALFDRV